jgi:Predicted transcription factor, homolog of eukaryotic MBF1
MYKETFPEKLKQARKESIYPTQEDVSEAIKIGRTVLSRYENGKLEPDIETLGKLADLYEVSLDWLVGTKGANKIK